MTTIEAGEGGLSFIVEDKGAIIAEHCNVVAKQLYSMGFRRLSEILRADNSAFPVVLATFLDLSFGEDTAENPIDSVDIRRIVVELNKAQAVIGQ